MLLNFPILLKAIKNLYTIIINMQYQRRKGEIFKNYNNYICSSKLLKYDGVNASIYFAIQGIKIQILSSSWISKEAQKGEGGQEQSKNMELFKYSWKTLT